MADEPRSWWQTVPGILTGISALLTAITGLFLALHQTGVIGGPSASAPTAQKEPMPSGEAAERVAPAGAPATTPPAPHPAPLEARLARNEVRLGTATYRILSARVEEPAPGHRELALGVRMVNDGSYGANFWDASFRLVVDDVPRAPIGGLNEVVESHAAKDGEVRFQLPADPGGAMLRILYGNDTTDIPIDIGPK